jgi:dipeptidyl aminopeptidase/acylaminoacyl peptidase
MPEIAVERCIVGRTLSEPRLHPSGESLVYVVVSGGVAALVWHSLVGQPERQLSAYPPPRPGRGFDGGCWTWSADADAIVYVATDGNLWWQPVPGGAVRRLTDHGPERTACGPSVSPDGRYVAYILDDAEVWVLSLDDGRACRVDAGGADFCFDPVFVSNGVVAWQAWSVPDMPWDAAVLMRATVTGEQREPVRSVGAVQQPRLMADGRLACIRDDHGWLNVWCGDEPLIAEEFEHAGPTWGPGQRSFVGSPDGRHLAFTRNEGGFGRLCVRDLITGDVRQVGRGVHGQLTWEAGRLAALRSGACTPTQIVVYDTRDWSRVVVAVGPVSGWENEPLAEPILVAAVAEDGLSVPGRLYPADTNSGRLLCWLHGGPTDQWQVTFMPRIAYWRALGWNVLVPDHRGSTGHGRDFQQALRGRWGEADVADVAAMLRYAHEDGWGTPESTTLIGGSAGGFTALGVAATSPHLIAATIAAYPVCDLIDLAERSHRFERHYTDSLVGPVADAADLLRRRSPVAYAPQLAARPLLIMHGDSDPVVPVEQSKVLAERVAACGGDVELHVYAGEGHGFRQPANQLDEYARIEAFLRRHVHPAATG